MVHRVCMPLSSSYHLSKQRCRSEEALIGLERGSEDGNKRRKEEAALEMGETARERLEARGWEPDATSCSLGARSVCSPSER